MADAATITPHGASLPVNTVSHGHFPGSGALSFVCGLIAALPEALPRAAWCHTRLMVERLEAVAADKGRFSDGYDLVADATCTIARLVPALRERSPMEDEQGNPRWPHREEMLAHMLRRAQRARVVHERALRQQMVSLGSAEARAAVVAAFDERVRAAEALAMVPSRSRRDFTLKKNAIGAAWLKHPSPRFDLIQIHMEADEEALIDRLAKGV